MFAKINLAGQARAFKESKELNGVPSEPSDAVSGSRGVSLDLGPWGLAPKAVKEFHSSMLEDAVDPDSPPGPGELESEFEDYDNMPVF